MKAALHINQEGWVEEVRHVASPNYDARPDNVDIDLLVIHNISLPPGEFGGAAIEQLFLNQLDPNAHPYFATLVSLRVSAHFLIRRDGEIVQFVACTQRAWHAGESLFQGRPRCNDFSLGIELEGSDFVAFEEAQYQALSHLMRALRMHYPLRAVRGHEHIAPGRKTDPGPFFDWARFEREAPWPVHHSSN